MSIVVAILVYSLLIGLPALAVLRLLHGLGAIRLSNGVLRTADWMAGVWIVFEIIAVVVWLVAGMPTQ